MVTFTKNNAKNFIGFLSVFITIVFGVEFMKANDDTLSTLKKNANNDEQDVYHHLKRNPLRENTIIVKAESPGINVLTKKRLLEAMQMHQSIEEENMNGNNYVLSDLCFKARGSCVSSLDGICQCLLVSILRQWNYDLETLQNDKDILKSLNEWGTKKNLEEVLENPMFDVNNQLIAAEAFRVSYFLEDESKNTDIGNAIVDRWESEVFLDVVDSVQYDYPSLSVDYSVSNDPSYNHEVASSLHFSLGRLSYMLIFLFLGAVIGKFVRVINPLTVIKSDEGKIVTGISAGNTECEDPNEDSCVMRNEKSNDEES